MISLKFAVFFASSSISDTSVFTICRKNMDIATSIPVSHINIFAPWWHGKPCGFVRIPFGVVARRSGDLPNNISFERCLCELLIVVSVVEKDFTILRGNLESMRGATTQSGTSTIQKSSISSIRCPSNQTICVFPIYRLVSEVDIFVSINSKAMRVLHCAPSWHHTLIGHILVPKITISANDRVSCICCKCKQQKEKHATYYFNSLLHLLCSQKKKLKY